MPETWTLLQTNHSTLLLDADIHCAAARCFFHRANLPVMVDVDRWHLDITKTWVGVPIKVPPCSAEPVLAESCSLDAQVGTIVWHVAAHEIGHAIYGLDGVKDAIKVSTKTLLEEPRAELTALHTMTLLLPAGLLKEVSISLVSCSVTFSSFPTHWVCRYASHASMVK